MFMKPFLFCLVSWVLLRSVANISSREVSFLTHKPAPSLREAVCSVHPQRSSASKDMDILEEAHCVLAKLISRWPETLGTDNVWPLGCGYFSLFLICKAL